MKRGPLEAEESAPKFTAAQQRWLEAQRAKWVPLSEQQALILRGALRSSAAKVDADVSEAA